MRLETLRAKLPECEACPSRADCFGEFTRKITGAEIDQLIREEKRRDAIQLAEKRGLRLVGKSAKLLQENL